MRITKKKITEAKQSFKRRCKELCLMTPEQLEAEVKRCFPDMTFTGTHGELLNFMIHDLIDLSIPTHWHEV